MAKLSSFMRHADTILDLEKDFNEIPHDEHTIFALRIQEDELKAQWTNLKGSYDACLLKLTASNNDDDDTVSLVKVKYRACYQTYVRCLATMNELSDKLATAKIRSEIDMSRVEMPMAGHNINLPPCDTELFHGDYLTWPSFRDMFSAIYIANNRLTPVEKLFHLNQKTRGEAKEIVQKSPLTHEGFATAWQNLTDRYENKRILVNSQLKVLFNLPAVVTESGSGIKKLQRDINNCISALTIHKVNISNWDAIFTYLCSTKLPETTLSLWEQSIQDKAEIPKWVDLDKFLTSRFQTLETVSDFRGAVPKGQKSTASSPNEKKVNTFQVNVTHNNCKLCKNQQHALKVCPKFLAMKVNERSSTVRRFHCCLNCLATNHMAKACKSNYSCSTCGQRHHSLLHKEFQGANNQRNAGGPSTRAVIQSTQQGAASSQASAGAGGNIQSCFASSSKGILLGTAIINICHRGAVFKARALIDSGSEGSFISERLQRIIQLPTRRVCAQVSGLNNVVSARVQKACTLVIGSPIDPTIQLTTNALILSKITGNLPSCSVDPLWQQAFPELVLADKRFYCSDQVDVLLGGDLYPQLLLDGIRRNILGSLLAQETIFGWILTGSIPTTSQKPPSSTVVSYFSEISLDRQLTSFWELEEVPQNLVSSTADKFCEDNFVKTTRRNPDGRYVVTLPFKESYPQKTILGDSRYIAVRQFLRNEVRLNKNLDHKKEYDGVLKEYLELGHMREVSSCLTPRQTQSYYLPHHAVMKPDSTTTKVRVVFNASSPTSNGISLNDVLHAGPVLQGDLTLLILKWRFFQFVFNGDIEKMYRQILVREDHQRFQRIIFRDQTGNHLQDFQLKTVTFGVNCAPFLALRTLLQLADDVESSLPLASKILRHHMYVDDALAGGHDVESTVQARKDLEKAAESAGFTLRKWTANSDEVLRGIPKSHRLREDFLELEDTSNVKTLGIRWNARFDYFYFHARPLDQEGSFSKREVLSAIAKLFDPAGWLAPVVVIAKILMQQVWLDGIGWDDQLTPSTLQRWQTFLENYPHIGSVRIPRWIDFSPEGDLQFHGFCDASEKAYGAAVYIRVRRVDSVSVHLLVAKTKVAPVKTVSLPRLELCGALLLAEMVEAFLTNLENYNNQLFLWTDSTIVLAWLRKQPCAWTTFVANRVAKISEKVGTENWSHVDSADNPADLASRGLEPQHLKDSSLWWHGPVWLKQEPSWWPNRGDEYDTTMEAKAIKAHVACSQNENFLERFSSLPRALRVLSYVLRFYYRTHRQHKDNFCHKSVTISQQEIKEATKRLVIESQKLGYPSEYAQLSKKNLIDSKSSILNLNPFLDSKMILRIGGRLSETEYITYDERHPVILPYDCQFSKLLVKFTHEISIHGGNQLVLRLIRMQYWIPRVKNMIKSIIHNCKVCVIDRKRLQTQMMASLPPERTKLSRPFASTGVDFTGPYDIKNYTGRACLITKGYICVFVCFATKAIHLEATSDLSAVTFLSAFTRFVSRRGCPEKMYSDNGTNFVGASRAFKEDFKAFLNDTKEKVVSKFAHQHLTWHFIPAGAPHMGGLWEAGVKSFKLHFRKVASDMKYTFEELSTLLSRIEACLNSRPLSPMSSDPNDLAPLTPAHFLVGGPLLAPIEPDIDENPISIINRWQKLKALNQKFCQIWKHDYLKELHKRYKWKHPREDLKIDDLVVIKADNLSATEWRLGRVVKVYSGSDNRVRVADLRTERGIITRPVVKLIILPPPP